ncbi:MAG: DUF3251 domain-containing protein [Nitrospira sp.]|nr:DUF3251 domain-containing protein [Nitrospira sp.]
MRSFLNGWGVAALLILLLVHSCDEHDEIQKLRKDLRKHVRELKSASVNLTPGSNGYQAIRHQLGSATLSLKEIKAHARGSIATLEIGNLTSVDITEATMEIGYPDPSNPSVEHSSKYDFQKTLKAGQATKITVVLEGVHTSTVTYLRISDFQPKGIRLIQAD